MKANLYKTDKKLAKRYALLDTLEAFEPALIGSYAGTYEQKKKTKQWPLYIRNRTEQSDQQFTQKALKHSPLNATVLKKLTNANMVFLTAKRR